MSHSYQDGDGNEITPLILLIRKHRKKILIGLLLVVFIITIFVVFIVYFIASNLPQVNLTGISLLPSFTQYVQTLVPENLSQMVNVFVPLVNFKQ
jgi:hypothetical protein